MKARNSHLLRLFITGTLTALPVAATFLVVGWALSMLLTFLGPGSEVGSVIASLGLGVTGSALMGYLMGLGLIAVFLVALGAVVERGLQRGVARLFDRLLRRIPVIRTVWDLALRITGLLQQREDQQARSMDPVWCTFGGPDAAGRGGASVLALLSSPEPVMVQGRACLAVLVPTAPIPVGGGLLFVPQEWVTPAELGAEALTSIYVSMGVTAPEHLPRLTPLRPAPPPSGF
jgi:uncharacterized membrane protein